MGRLKEIDGFRALAVLGVLWAHCWMFFGNIPFDIYKFPVNRVIAFGGVGVDLFFVISGFCMYYAFKRKYEKINWDVFTDFVKNRWLRIGPAFYLAVIIYTLDYVLKFHNFPLLPFIAHFLFIHTFFGFNVIAPHFWSLATEWHFYIILPVLFYLGKKQIGITRTTIILIVLCLLIRLIYWGYVLDSPLSIHNADRIYLRFVEFGWGILACIYFLDNKLLPKYLLGVQGFLTAFGIAFLGRSMNTTEIINLSGNYGFITKAISEPLMALGFTLAIQNSIQSNHVFTRILCSFWLQNIGRVSYSFYLWHWIICYYTCSLIIRIFGISNIFLQISYLVSAIITFGVSVISYKYIESVYYRQKVVAA